MRHAEICALVTMQDYQYEKLIKDLETEKLLAMSKYKGVTPFHVYVRGTPQCAGFGGFVGGFRGQEKWLAACKKLNQAILCRQPSDGMSIGWRNIGEGVFHLLGCNDSAKADEIVIYSHGVDISACKTPTEAIRLVKNQLQSA